MIRILFYLAPLLFMLIVVPIYIAKYRNGPSTWFPAQFLAIAGLIVALIILERGVFGDLGGPLYLMVMVLGVAVGNLVAFVALPRKKSP